MISAEHLHTLASETELNLRSSVLDDSAVPALVDLLRGGSIERLDLRRSALQASPARRVRAPPPVPAAEPSPAGTPRQRREKLKAPTPKVALAPARRSAVRSASMSNLLLAIDRPLAEAEPAQPGSRPGYAALASRAAASRAGSRESSRVGTPVGSRAGSRTTSPTSSRPPPAAPPPAAPAPANAPQPTAPLRAVHPGSVQPRAAATPPAATKRAPASARAAGSEASPGDAVASPASVPPATAAARPLSASRAAAAPRQEAAPRPDEVVVQRSELRQLVSALQGLRAARAEDARELERLRATQQALGALVSLAIREAPRSQPLRDMVARIRTARPSLLHDGGARSG